MVEINFHIIGEGYFIPYSSDSSCSTVIGNQLTPFYLWNNEIYILSMES